MKVGIRRVKRELYRFSTSQYVYSTVSAMSTHSPGKLVPNATKEMAVTESFIPIVQPKLDAKSPITAVSRPIIVMDTVKHAQPPQ